MSATDAAPTPDRDGPATDDGRQPLALGGGHRLASRGRPGMRWQFGGMITAAATTAPQVGATPTSSTPAMRVAPPRQSGRSQRRVGTITAIAGSVARPPPGRPSVPDAKRPPLHGGRRVRGGRARARPSVPSGARGGWSRPCRRGCAGSTAWRGGPGRGGRPRSSRSAGCGA